MDALSKWGDDLRAVPLKHVNCVDFEYDGGRGNVPDPVCMVVLEMRSGVIRRYWQDELQKLKFAPFETGADAVMVAYAAQAELGCFHSLAWPRPAHVLDLFAEFRGSTNGARKTASLLDALAFHNLPHIEATLKDTMRDLVLRGDWSIEEMKQILDYCQSDVEALAALLAAMVGSIDWPRALIRGAYGDAVASMENVGIPIDLRLLRRIRRKWPRLRRQLIAEVDADYEVFDGDKFKRDRFSRWLRRRDMSWPRLASGLLDLSDEAFKRQEALYPAISPLRELRNTVRLGDLDGLQVGHDARARTSLRPFAAVTGRNQPSTSRFPFGTAKWMRGFIAATPIRDLAYIDFASQEIAIAAGLSGDERLLAAYIGGDVYMAFAKDAGIVGPEATRYSHPHVRNACKVVVLGLNYGMGPHAMALQAGISVAEAIQLIDLHKRTYSRFWKWSGDAVETALLARSMQTVFGWKRRLIGAEKLTSIMNFPMQANGAEMMRVAAIGGVRAGIEVCAAPVHDAFLIAAPAERLEEDVAAMRAIMSRAGEVVCGVPVRTEAKLIRFPKRYMEERGVDMWNRVMRLANLRNALFEGDPTV
jgi:DNA polymerase-1